MSSVFGAKTTEEVAVVDADAKVLYVNFVVAEHLLGIWAEEPGFDAEKAKNEWNLIAEQGGGLLSKLDVYVICAKGFGVDANSVNDTVIKKCTAVYNQLEYFLKESTFIEELNIEKYDGTKTGTCTPSIRVKGKKDKLCSGSSYAKKDSVFQKIMDTKFRKEGGCAYAADKNCLTCYGVASKYHEVGELKTDKTGDDMFFNRNDAEWIAYERFYKGNDSTSYDMSRLPAAIRGDVFMAKWGTGNNAKSIGYLQSILGVKQTDTINDETVAAARNYKGDLRRLFLQMRWLKGRMYANKNNANGWKNAFKVYARNGCYSEPVSGEETWTERSKCDEKRKDDIILIKNHILNTSKSKYSYEYCLGERLKDDKKTLNEKKQKLQKDRAVLSNL